MLSILPKCYSPQKFPNCFDSKVRKFSYFTLLKMLWYFYMITTAFCIVLNLLGELLLLPNIKQPPKTTQKVCFQKAAIKTNNFQTTCYVKKINATNVSTLHPIKSHLMLLNNKYYWPFKTLFYSCKYCFKLSSKHPNLIYKPDSKQQIDTKTQSLK